MSISVIIPTKNRADLLTTCLNSLTNQTILPDEVVVINNNSTDHTSLVLKKFKSTLPLTCLNSTNSNYPYLYNRGIKKTRGNYIACLDDDCWVENKWVEEILATHQQCPNCVVQGRVINYPQHNIYAKIMGQHYQHWLDSFTLHDGSLAVLDTKNVSFPRKIIKKNLFNEKLSRGSHDIELGRRLVDKKIKIIHQPWVIAWHKERTTLVGFIEQHWRIAQSEAHLKENFENSQVKIILSEKNLRSLISIKNLLKDELASCRCWMLVYIPIIYIILLITRLVGFGSVWIKMSKTKLIGL